jgi:hypothetical protein
MTHKILLIKAGILPHNCSGAGCQVCATTARLRANAGEPTKKQAEAGNYPKKTVKWRGLVIKIENPAGSIRRGDTWETRMLFDYGYIQRTEAVDGDEVDVYLGPDIDTAPTVFIVHQRKYGDWKQYDEDKCMLGFLSEESAREAYLKQYDDPRFLGPITEMPVDEFCRKVKLTRDKPAMIKSTAEKPILFFKAKMRGDSHTIQNS